MTKLSVNINKIATLRNSRGGSIPSVTEAAIKCERYGADGITVHPRPDERHIRYQDVLDLKKIVQTEFNIEGYPNQRFMELVLKVKPTQATLVPDPPDVLTSNAGWDTIKNRDFLREIITELKNNGIRTSIFVDPNEKMASEASECGTDRIELYTEAFASGFENNPDSAIEPFVRAANSAIKSGLEINAGHDLNLKNLRYFYQNIPKLKEVSIGHALISDALYLGMENAVRMYKRELR